MEKLIKDNQLVFTVKSDLVASRLEELVSKVRNYFTEDTNYQEVVIDLSEIAKIWMLVCIYREHAVWYG